MGVVPWRAEAVSEGNFLLQYSTWKKLSHELTSEGSLSGLGSCAGSPPAKAFLRHSSASEGSAGRDWGRSGAGMTHRPLSSIWHQQRFALAPVIVQCKTVFKNKFGSRHWPSSPVLDMMVMETVTGTASRGAGKACHRDPINAEIIFQKHKPEIEQYIFGIKPKPFILVVLNTCSSYSKNALEKKSLKQHLKDEGEPLVCFCPCFACILCMREISPRFWSIPGLLLPVQNSRSALLGH